MSRSIDEASACGRGLPKKDLTAKQVALLVVVTICGARTVLPEVSAWQHTVFCTDSAILLKQEGETPGAGNAG